MTNASTGMMVTSGMEPAQVLNLSASALVVDDDSEVRTVLCRILSGFGISVTEAEDLQTAALELERKPFSMLLIDKCLPDGDGVEFCHALLDVNEGMACAIITGHASTGEAMESMEKGVFDYIAKPFELEKVRDTVRRILDSCLWSDIDECEVFGLGEPEGSKDTLVGRSPAMIEVTTLSKKIAGMSRAVLITGETGTGKEVVGRVIHKMSSRADKRFVEVNCGAIPQELIEAELFGYVKGAFTGANLDRVGLFEEANGGTIFLDEVTETTPAFQVKLLRVLQEGKIRQIGSNQETKLDVRVIAASNRNVRDEVSGGRFRQDLYFRLKGSEIYLPPLKERREDILPLIRHFAERTAQARKRQVRIPRLVMEVLRAFDWPGNVRELESAVDHAVQCCTGKVLLSDLPKDISTGIAEAGENREAAVGTYEEIQPLREVTRRYMEMALRRFGGNRARAAKALGVHRSMFSYQAKRAGDSGAEDVAEE